MKIWVPMDTKDFGAWLAYKWGAKFNYYIFVEGINVLLFMLFFLLISIAMILTYKPNLGDPIENIKNTYLYAELITIVILLCLTAIVSIFSNTKEKLIKNLRRIFIITITIIVAFIGIKIYLNKKYTRYEFNQIYEEKITNKNYEKMYTINLNSSNLIEQKSEKEMFVEQSIKAYKYFSIKSNFFIIIIVCIMVLEVYMIEKVNKQIKIKDRLEKDDIILEDSEINVKY